MPSRGLPKDATSSSNGSWRRRCWERAATFDDVGNVAAFAASDQARTITDSTINIACGTTMDYGGPPEPALLLSRRGMKLLPEG
jgi:hypothetical protein